MVQKQIVTLPIDAGVYTEQTERGARGRWYRADKVRFRKGLAEKLGGWVQKAPQFQGTARRLHDWVSLDGKKWTAIATELKLYLWQNETLYDITPLRSSGSLVDPFDTVNTSTTVTVNHVAHGGQVGDFVSFSNADAVGGITIDGEYRIITSDTDSYTITHSAAATSTVNGGGGTVAYEYDVSVGSSTAVTATGYSTGPYGREGYGNARTGSTTIIAVRTWSLDNWGEDLIASFRGGSMYYWDRTTGSSARAQLIAGAPGVNRYVIISQRDRHILSLGAYDDVNGRDDPLLVRWNSNEDLNDWLPTINNTAGDIRIYRGSQIITGIRTRLETLVWTDISVHSLIGQGQGIFGQNVVGENITIVGPNAALAIDHRVLFMADTDFYIYDGIVRVLNCDVRNFVFDNLVVAQKDKVYAGTNKLFNEGWWFYPSRDPDAWVQQDFSLGLPADYSLAIVSAGATRGYVYTFNSAGYTHATAAGAAGGEDTEDYEAYGTGQFSVSPTQLGDYEYFTSSPAFLSITNAIDPPHGNTLRSSGSSVATNFGVRRADLSAFNLTEIVMRGDPFGGATQTVTINGFFTDPGEDFDSTAADVTDTIVLDSSSTDVTKSLSFSGIEMFSFDFSGENTIEPHLIEFTVSSDIPYEHDLFLTNDEVIITPLEAEYAVEMDISPDYNNGPKYAGLLFLRIDVTGAADTAADDAQQFMVELDFDNDAIQVRKKEADGTISAPDNEPTNSVDVSDLTGTALAAGVKYVIKAQVDTPRVRVWLDDVLAFDFNLSAQELIDFTGGTAGLHVAADTDSDSSYRFYNFSASPLGVITDENFDISPIEVNRYVTVNYEEGTWTTGKLARTAWADKSPILDRPYAAGTDGFIYQHETGVDDNGSAMEVSIESFDIEIGEGEFLMHVDQLIPDFLTLEGSVSVSVTGKKYPGDLNRISKGPYTVSPGTRKVSTRFRARQVAIKVESNAMGDRWRMSHWRGRAGAHGKRG